MVFPMIRQLLLSCECGALRAECFEEAFRIEVHTFLISGNNELSKARAFGGEEEVLFLRLGVALDFEPVDLEVFFFEKILEGRNTGKGWIGKGSFDGEVAPSGDGAAQGDEFSFGADVGVTLIAAVRGTGADVVVEGDARRFGVGGEEASGGADGAGIEGDLVAVAVKV